MTVKELIKALQNIPEDNDIYLEQLDESGILLEDIQVNKTDILLIGLVDDNDNDYNGIYF